MNYPVSLLVCPPTYFRIAYEINPWMNILRQPDTAIAWNQWKALTSLLAGLAKLREIEPAPGAPDMVFTANAGLVHKGHVIISRFRHAQRRIEKPYFRSWFKKAGFEIDDWPSTISFEGAGDALFQREDDRLWFGHGIRSELSALPHLRKTITAEIVPMRLISPSFYHLDTCFCPLPGGAVMYYPEAFAAESRLTLYQLVPERLRIRVSTEDAHAFACNAIIIGTNVILNSASLPLRRQLENLGLTVWQCPVDEFIRAGGAVKCLTLALD